MSSQLLGKLTTAGFKVKVSNGNLLVSPIDKLTAAQRDYLKQHKAALIAELTAFYEAFTDDAVVSAERIAIDPRLTASYEALLALQEPTAAERQRLQTWCASNGGDAGAMFSAIKTASSLARFREWLAVNAPAPAAAPITALPATIDTTAPATATAPIPARVDCQTCINFVLFEGGKAARCIARQFNSGAPTALSCLEQQDDCERFSNGEASAIDPPLELATDAHKQLLRDFAVSKGLTDKLAAMMPLVIFRDDVRKAYQRLLV